MNHKIKTFEDALQELGEDHYLVKAYNAIAPLSECTDNIEAFIKLQIIAAALNEECEPVCNKVEKRYYPWFVTKNGIVSYADVIYASSDRYSFSSYRLALKTKELAEYMCTQFIDIWEQYLLG